MVTLTRVPVKQLSWIDRMYLKLENICVEVDKKPSLLLQETSKYMESQMNVVGTNVRKLCAELIQDLLPPPILSPEMAVKKPESAILCTFDYVASEKPKQKESWEKVLEVQAKGLNSDTSGPTSAPEDHSSSSATCMDNIVKGLSTDTSALEDHSSSLSTLMENIKEGGGSEIDCNGLGEVTTLWEGTGKVSELDEHPSRLEETAIQSDVIDEEAGMLMESESGSEIESNGLGETTTQLEGNVRCSDLYAHTSGLGDYTIRSLVMGEESDNVMEQSMAICAFDFMAQPWLKGAEPTVEGEMLVMRSDPKSTYGFNAGCVASCFKEKDHLVRNPTGQLDEEQEQLAQWFVSEDQRKLYRFGNSTYVSSFDLFDGDLQTQGTLEDFESDWELV